MVKKNPDGHTRKPGGILEGEFKYEYLYIQISGKNLGWRCLRMKWRTEG
jgi:hypothetical protein